MESLKKFYFSQIKPDLKQISLYIHIPFCKKKCNYCDFYSVNDQNQKKITEVIDQILAQFDSFITHFKDIKITTINIGGGTPSVLPYKELNRLFEGIRKNLVVNPDEFSIEANPESLDNNFLIQCRDYGISRISLGIQSFQNNLLSRLGRITNHQMNIRALERINSNWGKDFNVDLMTGLPGQNESSLTKDIDLACNYNPSHISLYALSIEKNSELENLINTGKLHLLPEELQEELWLKGVKKLQAAGYLQYEISNFAMQGKMCLHNLNYWKMNPYLGIGPGAVSTLPDQHNSVIRIYNPQSIDAYLSGKKNNWNNEYEIITPKEFLFETIMMGFRLINGINCKKFQKRFGQSFKTFFPETYQKWYKAGTLLETAETLSLSDQGRFILNRFLQEICEALDNVDSSAIQLNWP